MKLMAKVKGAIAGKPNDIRNVNVDADYVDPDPDVVRAYVIDELYIMMANEPCEIDEAGLEVLNMDEIIADLTPSQSTSD